MQKILKPAIAILCTGIITLVLSSAKKVERTLKPNVKPKIQVAILLDVSSSMDGLIEQAKAQLWNMVNTMGRAKCNEVSPEIEISLYEYGRTNNDVKKGYVKQINGFINNLDSLSENLFTLKTNGGEEYCGQAIYSSLNELTWDSNPTNYKVIFICGNEDFLQGNIKYTQACTLAKEKGVIVNTIYCGSRAQGIQEHWNLNAACGNGSFTFINTNASIEDIPTPYDSILYSMNDKLNRTYLTYGASGYTAQIKQTQMDYVNVTMSKTAGIKRLKAKANKVAYKNTSWDLVDAYEADSTIIARVEKNTLADSLKLKSKEEIKKIVLKKSIERNAMQNEVSIINAKRDAYLVAEKVKKANQPTEQNLENEVEKTIKQQAGRFNLIIK